MVTARPRGLRSTFPPLSDGDVTVEWDAGHAIEDLSAPPNAFEGGSWAYTVDSTAPLVELLITEFVADNENGIEDEDDDDSDWIEICNRGVTAANLLGR